MRRVASARMLRTTSEAHRVDGATLEAARRGRAQHSGYSVFLYTFVDGSTAVRTHRGGTHWIPASRLK